MTIKEKSEVTYHGLNRSYLNGRVGTVREFNNAHTSALVHFPATDIRISAIEWIGVGSLKEVKSTGVVAAISELRDQRDVADIRIREIDKEMLKLQHLQHERDELYSKKNKLTSAIRALENI